MSEHKKRLWRTAGCQIIIRLRSAAVPTHGLARDQILAAFVLDKLTTLFMTASAFVVRRLDPCGNGRDSVRPVQLAVAKTPAIVDARSACYIQQSAAAGLCCLAGRSHADQCAAGHMGGNRHTSSLVARP